MDGYAVAKELRRDASQSSTVLVALSGYAQPEDQRQAMEAGFDAHLAKPPDLDALAQMIARAPAHPPPATGREGMQPDPRLGEYQ
jgi:two-component system CheB/CheR fusion protein